MITKTYRIKDGKTVSYTISAVGYVTQTGTVTINSQDTDVHIDLNRSLANYTFSISTDSANTVIINGVQQTSLTAPEGTTITWSVSRTGYVTQSGTYILNTNHTEVITLVLDTVRFAIGRVTGYDNVLNTRTEITQDCTIIINGEERGFIDVVAGTPVSYTVSCPDYETYGPWYTTIDRDRTVDVELEKSTNQYTWTWSVTDINDNPLTGYEIWVNNQQLQGNSYTGTINSTCYWSCGKTGYITQSYAHNTDNYPVYKMYEDHSFNLKLVGEQTTWSFSVYDGSPSGGQLSGAIVNMYKNGSFLETYTTDGTSKTYTCDVGDVFSGTARKTGYIDQSFTFTVGSGGSSEGISLVAYQPASFWISPTPDDATVKMDGVVMPLVWTDTYSNKYYGGTFYIGDTVSWEVSKNGYVTRSNDISGIMPLSRADYDNAGTTMAGTIVGVALTAISNTTITFYVEDHETGSDLSGNIEISVNGGAATITDQIIQPAGSTITYTVSCQGYQDITGTMTVPAQNTTISLEMYPDVSDYLTMELTDAADELYWKTTNSSFTRKIEYSVDEGHNWTEITTTTAGAKINATVGQVIRFRYANRSGSGVSNNAYGSSSQNALFANKNYGTNTVLVYGNIKSISSLPSSTTASTSNYRYKRLFNGLDVANKYNNGTLIPIDLSDISITSHCFDQMFYGCKNLSVAPALPATTLAPYCYYDMFCGCRSLTTLPSLPATTLADYCYSNMFSSCHSITSIPNNYLPATTLTQGCYSFMFENCTSLTTIPSNLLPVTTLATECYSSMFRDCTSLGVAPVLPATTLVTRCYAGMYAACSSLHDITCLALNSNPNEECLKAWVGGVAAGGTFRKSSSATVGDNYNYSFKWGTYGVPEYWTVVNYTT